MPSLYLTKIRSPDGLFIGTVCQTKFLKGRTPATLFAASSKLLAALANAHILACLTSSVAKSRRWEKVHVEI